MTFFLEASMCDIFAEAACCYLAWLLVVSLCLCSSVVMACGLVIGCANACCLALSLCLTVLSAVMFDTLRYCILASHYLETVQELPLNPILMEHDAKDPRAQPR